jgi:hypothetical protein
MSAILDTFWTRRRKIADQRMEICKQCEHLKSFNRCDKCGCFMDGKTHVLDAECPIGKWKSATINMDETLESFGDKNGKSNQST